jgi:hypothetical protein
MSGRIAIMDGRGTPTTDIAFRVAKVLDVSLYDVLAGTALPPGTCTHCGRSSTAEGHVSLGTLDASVPKDQQLNKLRLLKIEL